MKRATEEGVEGLRHKPPPGATPRLSDQERARLPELLAQGAQAQGFRAELKVELGKAKVRLRRKREVILGCIRRPRFEV
jgi:transposase